MMKRLVHLKEPNIKIMNYGEKLKDPRWQKRRLEILQRDSFCCTRCNDKETELQVHHDKYSGEPWDVNPEFLRTLCKHCHLIEEKFKKSFEGCTILSIDRIPTPGKDLVQFSILFTEPKKKIPCVWICSFVDERLIDGIAGKLSDITKVIDKYNKLK